MGNAGEAVAKLEGLLGEIADLERAIGVLHWDQWTVMPPDGTSARAEVVATLTRLAHERAASDELGELLASVDPEAEASPDRLEALLRVARRDYDRARRIPPGLSERIARAAALGHAAWVQARANSDFALFRHALERNVELGREVTSCFPDVRHPYDALLDEYEPDMRTEDVRTLFARLRAGLVPLVQMATERAGAVDDSVLRGNFDAEAQRSHAASLLVDFGFDANSWARGESLHPFCTSFGPGDTRIANRFDQGNLNSIFSAMHEFGHGLYEANIDRSLDRTPLRECISLGVHESQSRMWENLVGRSRAFWRRRLPILSRSFPSRLDDVDLETFYRAINRVKADLIRVDADETTYNLHVILRFELEVEMFEGSLAVADLPEAWNERMRDYLGVAVPDDARGVLQDVHWSEGAFGYFPTYAIGNVIAVQLWRAAESEIGDLDGAIAAGNFDPLRSWLRERVHRHGRSLTRDELLDRVVGGPLDERPLLDHLGGKVAELYGP